MRSLLTLEQLKIVVHKKGLTQTDRVLLCLASAGGEAVSIAQIRAVAVSSGVKNAKAMNVSGLLSASKEKVFRTPNGWELSKSGREYVSSLAAEAIVSSPAAKEAQSLRAILPTLKSEESRAFLAEAIVCAEQSLYRAAVVLSWVGAVWLLYSHVVANCLVPFNVEATKRDPKWKAAKCEDDFGRMTEAAFLEVISAIGVIGKNVKQDLDGCLKLRNGCGHPNTLKLGANKVAAHLETLGMNVYGRFG